MLRASGYASGEAGESCCTQLLLLIRSDPLMHSSYSGYSRIGFDRRFRIFDISDYGETIRTYKRTEKDEILDEMYLVGSMAPAPYVGS